MLNSLFGDTSHSPQNLLANQYGYGQQSQLAQNAHLTAQLTQQAQPLQTLHNYCYNLYQQQTPLKKVEWMYNGEEMTITEFADKVFGDTPKRTEFLLKHSEK